jgi:hypothetical protein
MESIAQDMRAHETFLRAWLDRTLSDDRIEHNRNNNDYYGEDTMIDYVQYQNPEESHDNYHTWTFSKSPQNQMDMSWMDFCTFLGKSAQKLFLDA